MSVLERTDHDRATFAPMRLTFGGEPRDVWPLPIKQSRPWKKQLGEAISKLAELADLELLVPAESAAGAAPDPDKRKLDLGAVPKVVDALLSQAPDSAADIVWAYLKAADASLERAWFDEQVTDEEIAEALPVMIEVTVLPLVRKVGDLAAIARALPR